MTENRVHYIELEVETAEAEEALQIVRQVIKNSDEIVEHHYRGSNYED